MLSLFRGTIIIKLIASLIAPVLLIGYSYLIVPILSYCTRYSFNDVISIPRMVLIYRILLSITMSVTVLLLDKLKLEEYLFKIKNQENRLKVFLALEVIMLTNLIITSTTFRNQLYHVWPIMLILSNGITALLIFGTALFMLVGFEKLTDYKLHKRVKSFRELYKNIIKDKREYLIKVHKYTHVVESFIINEKSMPEVEKLDYISVIQHNIFPFVYEEDIKKVKTYLSIQTIETAINTNQKNYGYEYRLLNPQENILEWYRNYISIEVDEENQWYIIAILMTNIQAEKDLIYQAERDGLSGLYNKKCTENKITKYLKNHADGILLLIDLDNFKAVNDKLGHDMGDYVIQDVAQKLTLLFRSDDVIGRIGGDEFLAFIKGVKLKDLNIDAKGEQICQSIRHTYSKDNINVTISSSVGICEVRCNETFNDVYQRADKALYESKNNGKNRYTVR